MFRKWKDFDKLHVQTKKMLIENTINIFSQSRSKENSKDSINSVLVVADRHLYRMLFASLSLSSFIILFYY